jgi:hypothetical protein
MSEQSDGDGLDFRSTSPSHLKVADCEGLRGIERSVRAESRQRAPRRLSAAPLTLSLPLAKKSKPHLLEVRLSPSLSSRQLARSSPTRSSSLVASPASPASSPTTSQITREPARLPSSLARPQDGLRPRTSSDRDGGTLAAPLLQASELEEPGRHHRHHGEGVALQRFPLPPHLSSHHHLLLRPPPPHRHFTFTLCHPHRSLSPRRVRQNPLPLLVAPSTPTPQTAPPLVALGPATGADDLVALGTATGVDAVLISRSVDKGTITGAGAVYIRRSVDYRHFLISARSRAGDGRRRSCLPHHERCTTGAQSSLYIPMNCAALSPFSAPPFLSSLPDLRFYLTHLNPLFPYPPLPAQQQLSRASQRSRYAPAPPSTSSKTPILPPKQLLAAAAAEAMEQFRVFALPPFPRRRSSLVASLFFDGVGRPRSLRQEYRTAVPAHSVNPSSFFLLSLPFPLPHPRSRQQRAKVETACTPAISSTVLAWPLGSGNATRLWTGTTHSTELRERTRRYASFFLLFLRLSSRRRQSH